MASIGNMAFIQTRMAMVSAQYQVTSNSLFGNGSTSNKNTSVNDAMEQILKNKNDYIQQEYQKLYEKVFGKEESESAEGTISLKGASKNAENSAYDITSYANSLRYGGEFDASEAEKMITDFVDNYNTFIDKVGDAESTSVLQKGVIMVNTAKVYSGSLGRVGISLGSDNKLTFDPEKMSQIDATDLKTTFGTGGFASKVSQKAQQIGNLAGSSGYFGYSAASTQSYAYTIGALFSTYA